MSVKKALFYLFGAFYRRTTGTWLSRFPGAQRLFSVVEPRIWASDPIIDVQGSKMHADPKVLPVRYRKTFRPFVYQGVWEEITTQLFRDFIKEGDTVIDVGANMGYFTLLASRLVGNAGKVHAFEPEPVNYDLLNRNIALNGYRNITAIQKAVSNNSGNLEFCVHQTDAGRHTLRACISDAKNESSILVRCITLDEYFKAPPYPTFVKLDIEGAELFALEGMSTIIESMEGLHILMEFYPDIIRRAGYSVLDFCRRLCTNWQFEISVIDEYTRDKRMWRIKGPDDLVALADKREVSNLLLTTKSGP